MNTNEMLAEVLQKSQDILDGAEHDGRDLTLIEKGRLKDLTAQAKVLKRQVAKEDDGTR